MTFGPFWPFVEHPIAGWRAAVAWVFMLVWTSIVGFGLWIIALEFALRVVVR